MPECGSLVDIPQSAQGSVAATGPAMPSVTLSATAARHPIRPRQVHFDLDPVPLHWIPDDAFSSHLINGIHLLLPAGEFWFCRVYNKALPLITDPQLRADVAGFIRQEAIHARVHQGGQAWLRQQGIETDAFVARVDLLFGTLLGDAPLGIRPLQQALWEQQWLTLRVGIIAAIEHFTGMLGQWAMDNTSWDRADPVMADLFRWHLAEEVEHRCVAFDLYEHLCRNQGSFYLSRQALMALVFPLFIQAVMDSFRSIAAQDNDRAVRRLARRSTLQLVLELERAGRRTQNVPTFGFLVAGTLRWVAPGFHPQAEGDTEQALAYMARSPAARAAEARRQPVAAI